MVVSSFSRHTFSCPCELAKAKPRIFEWVRKPYAGNAKQSQFHCLALHGISLAFSLLTLEHFKNLSFQNMLSFKNNIAENQNSLPHAYDFHPLLF